MENTSIIKQQIVDRISSDPEMARKLLKNMELEIWFRDVRARSREIAKQLDLIYKKPPPKKISKV